VPKFFLLHLHFFASLFPLFPFSFPGGTVFLALAAALWVSLSVFQWRMNTVLRIFGFSSS
jgi:hypothetical protein